MKEEKEEGALVIWDCGSPLYDSYELASLSHLIDRHMMALPSPGGSIRYDVQSRLDSGTITTTTTAMKMMNFREVGMLTKYAEGKMWKRKMMITRGRKEKQNKLKNGFYRICSGLCFMEKQQIFE
ncbi:uncharacterized protein LOC114313263 [Camellia sinensis]|uniref:Uncharacterized protein n=1 Tax=Camellia sinensis var. sinensis TaxID=542762 RepID=A0A4V3WK15_CAMSN|nr:uncharacterized protein LOC114313263 [Camellia sinensis]THF99136.1 hypothetical protein TEA_027883 [Camellia sinensis var. sinensis]